MLRTASVHRALYAPVAACAQDSPGARAPIATSMSAFQFRQVSSEPTSVCDWAVVSDHVPTTDSGTPRQVPKLPSSAASPDAPELQVAAILPRAGARTGRGATAAAGGTGAVVGGRVIFGSGPATRITCRTSLPAPAMAAIPTRV